MYHTQSRKPRVYENETADWAPRLGDCIQFFVALGGIFFCLTLLGGHVEAIGAVRNFVVGRLRALHKSIS